MKIILSSIEKLKAKNGCPQMHFGQCLYKKEHGFCECVRAFKALIKEKLKS